MTLLIRSRLDNKGNKPPPEAYAFNTSRLISKLDSVEVRAICRFGLTGDWEEVLNEAGGSMTDTLALALKWAEDGSVSLLSVAPSSLPCSRLMTDLSLQVRTYLREIRGAAMASGDLMGLGKSSAHQRLERQTDFPNPPLDLQRWSGSRTVGTQLLSSRPTWTKRATSKRLP